MSISRVSKANCAMANLSALKQANQFTKTTICRFSCHLQIALNIGGVECIFARVEPSTQVIIMAYTNITLDKSHGFLFYTQTLHIQR